jgi:hypothetical protein
MLSFVLAAMSIGSVSALRPTMPISGRHLQYRSRSTPLQLSEKRWSEDILDDSLPDPIFDRPSDFEKPTFGICNNAEVINGRVAMMAFTVLYLQEAIVGQGVLTQYGLSYDEGAIVEQVADGFTLPAPVGLAIAGAIAAGAVYAGEFLDDKFRDTPVTGITKLPFGGARKK